MPTAIATALRRPLALALLALPLLSPSGAQAQPEWQPCAGQGQVCRFEGDVLVRYGAQGRYAFRVAHRQIRCDVDEFGGDPAVDVAKHCEFTTNINRVRRPSAFDGWIYCASEGQPCRVDGPIRVRYGADNRYAYRNANGSIPCSVKVFGDPAFGVNKTCDYQLARNDDRNNGRNNDRDEERVDHGRGWEYCGREGDFCRFKGPGEVRYGINGRFVARRVVNGMPCTVEAFGEDPAFGRNKQCFVRLGR